MSGASHFRTIVNTWLDVAPASAHFRNRHELHVTKKQFYYVATGLLNRKSDWVFYPHAVGSSTDKSHAHDRLPSHCQNLKPRGNQPRF